MKSIFLLFYLISCTFILNSQIFGSRQWNNENYYSTIIKSKIDNNYRVLDERWGALNSSPTSNIILIDSVIIPKNIALITNTPIYENNRILWAAIEVDTITNNNNFTNCKLLIVEMNLNCNITNINYISTATNTFQIQGMGSIGLSKINNNYFIHKYEGYSNSTSSETISFDQNVIFSNLILV